MGGAVDDMGIGRGKSPDGVHRQAGFAQLERTLGGGDQHQHTLGTREVNALKQGAGYGLFSCDTGPVRTGGLRCAHHGLAGLAHHGAHVLKVDIHMALDVDDFRNTAHGVLEHVIGTGEGFILCRLLAKHFHEFFVEHDDERVDIGFQLGQASFGIAHALVALKVKRLGHHAHGQDAHFARHPCDHRSGACARAAAHAGGDEQHVSAFDRRPDVFNGQFCGFTATLRDAACTQASQTELDDAVRIAAAQRLGVGIGTDEFHALNRAVDHVADGVATTATDANNLDPGALVESFFFDHFDRHFCSPG